MRILLIIFIFGIVHLSFAGKGQGCRRALGKCIEDCPEGTHEYNSECKFLQPEPTCENPNPYPELDIVCDYSACYCDPPTIRDSKLNTCVKVEDCTKAQ